MLMLGKALTVEQRLTKAVVDIMANPKYVALAGVLMVGSRRIDDTAPTAWTNGRDELYGRAFVESMNDAQLRFLVLHECYHKLYKHLTTWRWMYDENPQLANIACDYVINIKIADDNQDGFAVMPSRDGKPIGLIDPKYRGMDSAAVYHLLRKDQESGGGASGSGTGINEAASGLDDHGWEDAKEMTEQEKQALARDIDEAIRQGALAAGKLGHGGDRSIEALLEAKVDWREALREFLSTTCAGNDYSTWTRPNRRFISSGYYMPSGISEQVGDIVVAVDTSGSIGTQELSQFLGEVKGICDTVRPDSVRLLYWDTAVAADELYTQDRLADLPHSTKPAGGGGTDVSCVPEYLTTHGVKPKAVVVLTDGYLGGRWGSWDTPVLWCIVGGNKVTAPIGKTVNVKD